MSRLRMKLLLFIILLTNLEALNAQENIDSLISSWNKISKEYIQKNENDSACKYGNCVLEMLDQKIEMNKDQSNSKDLINMKRTKAEALCNLVTAYGNSNRMKLAMECYEAALNIFREIGANKEIYQLYIRMGRVNDLRTGYSEAIRFYDLARDQAVINKDKEGEARCYYYIGLNNRYLGNYSEALKYHLLDLQIQDSIGNKSGIANAYITIAAILNRLNDTDAAFEKLQAALQLFSSIGDTMGIATVYNDFGMFYYGRGDTAKALENHLHAANLRETVKEFNGLGASYIYISEISMKKGDYNQAKQFLKKSIEAFRNAENLQGEITALINMSDIYLNQNDPDSAMINLERAKVLATSIMNQLGLVTINSKQGNIYFKKEEYNRSIYYFDQALSIANQINAYKDIFQINAYLADIHKMTGQYKQALEHQYISMHFKDLVDSNANLQAAVQLDIEYNYKQEKIKNELLQNQKDQLNAVELKAEKIQKQLFFAGVVMFVIVSLGLWSRLRFIRKAGRELLERKDEADRLRFIAESEKQKATRSEKIKEQFLANMSHEIRTPMNAINGITDILIRNEHPKSQDKYLAAIKESSESLLLILNEILDLSKLEAGKIEPENIPFDPRKIIRNVINILRFKAEEKGLELKVKLDSNIPHAVCSDPTHLNQILLNLTSNAIKFTDKGSVVVEAERIADKNESIILRFRVVDTGIGIPTNKLDQVFDIFTQADTDTTRKYGGTGLGLSICKRLVELHDGQIFVESELNKGSIFTVELPFRNVPEENKPEIKIAKPVLKDIRILLAEDNEFNVIVARDVLENSIPGASIEVTGNGKEALEKLKSKDFDLILMDIHMPVMDGFDATRQIRKMSGLKANIPIMAMTANVLKTEVDKCYEVGMNGYIAKPFERDDLIDQINKVMELQNNL